jgi:hypothetical protein
MDQDQFVKLNVGGNKYVTTRSTLSTLVRKPPESEEVDDDEVLPETEKHYLANLVSGMYPIVFDSNQNILIDRDGKHFGFILNYLRSVACGSYNHYVLPWNDQLAIEELKIEAEYYGLHHLVAVLEEGDYDVTWNRYYEESFILQDCRQHSLLNRWYGNRRQPWQLVYRASRDGFNQKIYAGCYSRGPTMTIIECRKGNVFGAYLMNDWNHPGEYGSEYTSDRNAFLFSLKNPHRDPQKLPIVDTRSAFKSITEFPSFGRGDLTMHGTWGTTNIGGSYLLPNDRTGSTFLTGKYQFDVREIEIFVPLGDSHSRATFA